MSAPTYLPHARRLAIIGVVATCALAFASNSYAAEAGARDAPQPNDELDVTMQVIADPNAKLPEDVIRRIPLPPRKPDAAATSPPARRDKGDDASSRGDERSREAREVGREISERAQERSQDATQQREQARRAIADERRRNPDPPRSPPDPPRPPR